MINRLTSKVNVPLITATVLPFILTACATTRIRVPGETTIDNKYIDRTAALKALPPTLTGCIASTPDYVVTGSETTVSGDEHCFPSDGAGGFGPRMDIPGLSRVDGMDVPAKSVINVAGYPASAISEG